MGGPDAPVRLKEILNFPLLPKSKMPTSGNLATRIDKVACPAGNRTRGIAFDACDQDLPAAADGALLIHDGWFISVTDKSPTVEDADIGPAPAAVMTPET
jgi:hypothetical protein